MEILYCIWYDCTAYTGKHNWTQIYIYITDPYMSSVRWHITHWWSFYLTIFGEQNDSGIFGVIFNDIRWDFVWCSMIFCDVLPFFKGFWLQWHSINSIPLASQGQFWKQSTIRWPGHCSDKNMIYNYLTGIHWGYYTCIYFFYHRAYPATSGSLP